MSVLETVLEPARRTPIMERADVVVAGGGPAGFAAAVAAARTGRRVVLLERYEFLGGQLTAGGVSAICGLFMLDRGAQRQIIHGIADEVWQRLRRRRACREPEPVGRSALVVFQPMAFRAAADELVEESGVRVYYHTWVADVVRADVGDYAVLVETKSGRRAVLAPIVIDATGDADVAVRAGASCRVGQNGVVQPGSMMFRMHNVDEGAASAVSRTELQRIMEAVIETGEHDLPRTGGGFRFTGAPGEVVCNINRVLRDGAALDASDVEQLTYAEIEGRRQVELYASFLREKVPGFADAYVGEGPAQVGVRETRLVDGEYVLKESDVLGGAQFADAVTSAAWALESHDASRATRWRWLDDGVAYQIPYRCLIPKGLDGLLVVGRCMSTTHAAQASTRVSAICMAVGQAAGVAAGVALEKGVRLRDVDLEFVRYRLRAQGALMSAGE